MQPSTPTSPYGVPQNLNQSAAREVPQRSSRYEAAAAEFGFMTDPAHIRRCMRSLTPGAGLRRLPSPYAQFPPVPPARAKKWANFEVSKHNFSRCSTSDFSCSCSCKLQGVRGSCGSCHAPSRRRRRQPASAMALRPRWQCARSICMHKRQS